MDKKTLSDLDYYRIREEIGSFCVAEESRFMLTRLEPLTNFEEIEKRKSVGKECLFLLASGKNSPVHGWNPVFPLFRELSAEGKSFSLAQMADIALFCQSAVFFKTTVLRMAEDAPLTTLCELAQTLPDITPAYDAVNRVVTPDGQVRDLPELRALREKITSLNARIKSVMHSFTSNSRYADVLESDVPVLRGGRQVLAVKASRRTAISGIVHEFSQSGLTVYIEPDEAVKCTNELVQAEYELESEIRRILLELAEKLRPYTPLLTDSLKIMEYADSCMAGALWGQKHAATFAETAVPDSAGKCRPITLISARHPLLGDSAVPVDIRFLPEKKVLIITGPNTGGKTVTLKTIALFSMLNQSGFPVPAAEGSVLPIFSSVFADIGDEQSLDQSLSTFSGHMKNIARAVRSATSDSLVLLDELGSGTDPQEGSAISMAVLDCLIEKNATVLITTHHGAIKNYGFTHSACVNASVEFNENTLSPTYRLVMGVPGESHALDIAKKSGLAASVIENAKKYLATEQADVSSLIKGLTQKHAELNERERAFLKQKLLLDDKEFIAKEKSLELRQKELLLKQGVQRETQEFLAESRKKLENLVRELREGELTKEKTVGVKQFINDFTAAVQEQEKSLEQEEEQLLQDKQQLSESAKNRVSHKAKKKKTKLSDALKSATVTEFATEKKSATQKPLVFESGAEVMAISANRRGVILGAAGKGKWNVQFGSISIVMKEKDLSLVKFSESPVLLKADYTVDLATRSEGQNSPVFELRLLGMRAEEALRALEHQLDLCILNNFRNFSIIHGKGNGILQQTVQDYLSNCPAVQDFSFAAPEDGGFGKTYVTLR